MGFLCFESNRTMWLLAVDFHGGVGGSAPSLSWLSAEGPRRSPARSQVWRAPVVLWDHQESLGEVRPPCSSDLLLLTSSHSLSEWGKHKELSPPVHSRAVPALTGASADMLVILLWHSSLGGQGA